MDNYHDIRPFNDAELIASIKELKAVKEFRMILNFYLPEQSDDQIAELLTQVEGYHSLYSLIIRKVAESVIEKTMDGFSYSGLDELKKDGTHLFISNHRDIICDSGLINYVLFKEGHSFLEAAIGNNLVANDWVKGLIRINQNFLVRRDLKGKALLQGSMHLSSYIKHSLTEKGKNIWIAQREGRTKDGNDETQQALLRMISLNADRKTLVSYMNGLKIVPVSISYGIEPCVALKVRENYLKETEGSYQKGEGEDVQSMVRGITGKKGKVHIHFGKPVEIEEKEGQKPKQILEEIKSKIDASIIENYKASSFSKAALSILGGQEELVSSTEKDAFQAHIKSELEEIKMFQKDCIDRMTALYAAPLLRKKKASI